MESAAHAPRPPTVITLARHHSANSAHSSTTSLSSEHRRVPGIRYPTVAAVDTRTSSPHIHGSIQGPQATIDRLREENARLRLRAEEITADSNRRVEMHIAEIRMLKEETKRLRGSIGELEGERNKARQLAHEWHKFARYSSDLVKQEVRTYDAKLREATARMRRLREENEELRQICLYLDEQRHAISGGSRRHSARSEEESDDQGCGSSDHSMEAREAGGEGYCLQKEDSLRRICQRSGETAEKTGEEKSGEGLANDRLLHYIHSLESRIKHLEVTTAVGASAGHQDSSWRSSLTPESEDLTVMEREWEGRGAGGEGARRGEHERMMMAQSTSTMTSSGTTFCSSEMDEMMLMTSSSSTVFVDGTEPGYATHLEVRTLPPIEEERKDDLSQSTSDDKRLSAEVALSALLPPCMEPITASTIGLSRYRGGADCSMSSGSSTRIQSDLRASEESLALRHADGVREPRSVSEAVDALRMREQRAAQHADNPYARWTSIEHKYLSAL